MPSAKALDSSGALQVPVGIPSLVSFVGAPRLPCACNQRVRLEICPHVSYASKYCLQLRLHAEGWRLHWWETSTYALPSPVSRQHKSVAQLGASPLNFKQGQRDAQFALLRLSP